MQIISFSGRTGTSHPPIRGITTGRGYVCVVTGDKVRVFEEKVR